MNIVICVAAYKSIKRIRNFVKSLARARGIEKAQVICVNTGPVIPQLFHEIDVLPDSVFVQVKDYPRKYNQVMQEKVKVCSGYCDHETVLISTDDDYVFGEWSLEMIKQLFEENKQLHYMSMLRTALPEIEFEECWMSDLPFYRVESMMGGAIACRAYTFLKDVGKYWTEVKHQDAMFDQGFWRFVASRQNRKDFIFMPKNMSFAQHCNLGSNFIDMKSGPDDHMSGINFIEDHIVIAKEKRHESRR